MSYFSIVKSNKWKTKAKIIVKVKVPKYFRFEKNLNDQVNFIYMKFELKY